MNDEFASLSDLELLSLIRRAQEESERRKEANKRRLRTRIEDELKKAGVSLSEVFPEIGADQLDDAASLAQKPRMAKFKNHATGDAWSGRGPHPPNWVKAIMAERGWTLDEFKAAEEFQAQN
ncbi:H-NS family nucleoid-associated regulatory protein [Methylocystis parvus]|uniref:H-NS histone family protein n=1 Tax=Methylocystis parvus TaxID=134 RepID=A0A6B8LYX5_9HYPH|nr:H-NS family nucleoid-associated regulatory protein [Methylocystis parvus]QGM96664.1 H-NS histone family protein [Methylocystis parvus]WBJ99474.1 H-NS histone family protein [Methylocystis parvus OBBP]